MKGMSEREYAAHSGLSRGGVQKARKNGRLVVYDDGSINAAASDVRRAEMTDPDQQRRSLGGDGLTSAPGETTSYIKARTALTVYAAQERQLAVQKKKGTLVDRARAETLVFRLARQERDVWVTWPGRVAALMAAQIMAEVERQSGASVTIETAIMQRVLEAHVREQLAAGDVAGAAEVLGRPHRVSGMVVHGAGRGGRELGYPTANLDLAEGTAIPTDGVYAGWFTLLDGDDVDGSIESGRRYAAAISVGTNPTFNGTRRTVEAFVLDETADLYDRRAAVEFVGHVREMEKFSSVAELLAAMDRDVRRTRQMLGVDPGR